MEHDNTIIVDSQKNLWGIRPLGGKKYLLHPLMILVESYEYILLKKNLLPLVSLKTLKLMLKLKVVKKFKYSDLIEVVSIPQISFENIAGNKLQVAIYSHLHTITE